MLSKKNFNIRKSLHNFSHFFPFFTIYMQLFYFLYFYFHRFNKRISIFTDSTKGKCVDYYPYGQSDTGLPMQVNNTADLGLTTSDPYNLNGKQSQCDVYYDKHGIQTVIPQTLFFPTLLLYLYYQLYWTPI